MSTNSQEYNILFLMNGLKPPRGAEFLTLNFLKNLRKDIFHSILAYAQEGVIVQEIKRAGIDSVKISVKDKLANVYLREGKLYNPFFIMRLIWCLVNDRSFFQVRKLLKENDIHLIYCADNLSKLIGGIAGKMTKIKVVAHCHDDFQEDLLGKTMRVFYLLLIDKILAVSDKVKKYFKIRGRISEKVVTVYNGISKDIYSPENVDSCLRNELGINKDIIVIGSIGALEKDRGHKYLFEAIIKLKLEGINNLTCIICGTGPEDAELRKFVHKKELEENVFFLGSRNDIPKVLKILNLFVQTSLTIESFSIAVAEAMSMKIPVIATKTGGLPEVVDDGVTGILVPPGDVEALSDAIKYLVRNPEIRLKMGEDGRKRVIEKFTIEKNVRETEKIFLDMINGKN